MFYVGNLMGESGDSATHALVNASDITATYNQHYTAGSPAPITARADYDRDGLINASDGLVAQHSIGKSLPLFTAPAAPAALPSLGTPNLFSTGDNDILAFNTPGLVTTTKGTVLAIAEERSLQLDTSSYGIVMRRSTDGGVTWSAISTIYAIAPGGSSTVGGPTAVVDATTGTILVLFSKDSTNILVSSSSDDGLTWSAPVDITSSVKVTDAGNPNPAAYPNTPWGMYNVGPGHGIQLQNGSHAGRILIDANHWLASDPNQFWSNVIYSDDHGQTWHLGGGLDQSTPQNNQTTENSMVELPDGSIYMVVRDYQTPTIHGYSRSTDGGMTWSSVLANPNLTTGLVEASLLRLDANTLLFAAPDTSDGTRHQLTIWVSHDNASTWVKTKVIDFGASSYSDMTLIGPDTALIAYISGDDLRSISLARFDLAWLEGDSPYQFTWDFNEQAPARPPISKGHRSATKARGTTAHKRRPPQPPRLRSMSPAAIPATRPWN